MATGTIHAPRRSSMPKALAISGMIVAAILLLIFGLDLAVGIPFHGASTLMDVGFILCALLLAYMGFSAWRDLK